MKKRVLYHSFSKHFWNSWNICFWLRVTFYTADPSDFERRFLQWVLPTSSYFSYSGACRLRAKYDLPGYHWNIGTTVRTRSFEKLKTDRPQGKSVKKAKSIFIFLNFIGFPFHVVKPQTSFFFVRIFTRSGKLGFQRLKIVSLGIFTWHVFACVRNQT